MPEFLSDQITKLEAEPQEFIPPDERFGRQRRQYFSFTAPAGMAAADTVRLTRLNGRGRLFGGKVVTDGLGATVTLDLGDGTTANKYLDGGDVAAATELDFGHTDALEYGEKPTATFDLTGTFGVAGPTEGQVLKGHIDFVVD